MIQYQNVNIEGFACELPEARVTSAELEGRLDPVYQRLKLPHGRLELMTGIQERRFWNPGTLPSETAARAARKLLDKCGVPPARIGCLLHCAVSRDAVEPASSTAVHRRLGMRPDTLNFDISNACLGMLSGIMVIANMIELGQIDFGLAVSGENGGPLVDNTIRLLNTDPALTRKSIKSQFASLTIGSAAAAVLLVRRSLSRMGHRLLAAASYSDCTGSSLCQGDVTGGMTDDSAPLMQTDSPELMRRGVDVAGRMWNKLRDVSGWTKDTPDVICGHQVGKFHRDLLFKTLGLPLAKDFSTFPFMGNCGSASLPLTCALAEESGFLKNGDKLLMLGIGSGINASGLTVQW